MKIKLTFPVFALLLLANTANAAHYVSGESSVDAGEIRWGGSTKYASEWSNAITTWNDLGSVTIAPDSIWTYQDLTVKDVYSPSSWWGGLYDYDIFGADEIYFNTHEVDEYAANRKKAITMHELGHALGLAHSIPGNIMVEVLTIFPTLGTQDKNDYHYLWSN